MLRDKDAALAEQCRALTEASKQALNWFADNDKTVGWRKANLERLFKKNTVEARKLANAAERAMSVGVFGQSQAGKSFLIGSFIAPAVNPVKVIFGDPANPTRMDFLSEVNPSGGDETTGLVTRFSIRPHPTPSKDYPVALRLLTEGDVIKILANTFAMDLRGRPDRPFDERRIADLVQEAEATGQKGEHPGLSVEAILDLEQYIQEELDLHPLNTDEKRREEYWIALERLAPKLGPADRAKLVAPLWGEIPEFTALYLELRGALDEVAHSPFAFATLDAIRDRSNGVLHVRTIYHLDPAGADGAFAKDGVDRVSVMNEGGRVTSLRKAVVTALTAELCVTLESKPWPFFEHTDLLDFPGARSRESKSAGDFLRGEDCKPQNRAYCYLRGKIAVLFDKYSAELDLNTMLLCADDRNYEVRNLADLVQRWVARTHGPTSDERVRRKTALFLCLTKSDLMFDTKAGTAFDAAVHNRVAKDIEFYASWTKAWAGEKPFDSIVFSRNPKFKWKGVIEYEPVPDGMPTDTLTPERRMIPDVLPEFAEKKAIFCGLDIIKTHVADAAARFDALLSINDGGITYIAEKLAPTCDPDLKYNQVNPRARSLAERMRTTLSEFHEAGDIGKRVAERRAAALKVVACLRNKPALIGPFIACLETDEETMGAVFLDVARGDHRHAASDPTDTTTSSHAADAGDFDLGDLGDLGLAEPPADEAPPQRQGLAAVYGEAAIRRWLFRIEDAAQNTALAETYGLGAAEFTTVVQELEIAARRYRLAERIAESVRPVIQYHQRPDEHMHRVAMVTRLEINNLVNRLGRDRPDVENGGDVPFQRGAPELADGLPVLPNQNDELRKVRGKVMLDWLKALVRLAEESAASGEGGVIDIEQNARMGRILDLITPAVAD